MASYSQGLQFEIKGRSELIAIWLDRSIRDIANRATGWGRGILETGRCNLISIPLVSFSLASGPKAINENAAVRSVLITATSFAGLA